MKFKVRCGYSIRQARGLAYCPLFDAAAQILKNRLLPLLHFKEDRLGE
jgi:hypothetical protein